MNCRRANRRHRCNRLPTNRRANRRSCCRCYNCCCATRCRRTNAPSCCCCGCYSTSCCSRSYCCYCGYCRRCKPNCCCYCGRRSGNTSCRCPSCPRAKWSYRYGSPNCWSRGNGCPKRHSPGHSARGARRRRGGNYAACMPSDVRRAIRAPNPGPIPDAIPAPTTGRTRDCTSR